MFTGALWDSQYYSCISNEKQKHKRVMLHAPMRWQVRSNASPVLAPQPTLPTTTLHCVPCWCQQDESELQIGLILAAVMVYNHLFIYSVSGISESYQMGIFRILAGILHLGNVAFTSRDSDSCAIPVSLEHAWCDSCLFVFQFCWFFREADIWSLY